MKKHDKINSFEQDVLFMSDRVKSYFLLADQYLETSKLLLETLIQNIKTKPNYRTDKLVDVNKDEWIITENHHEPIINKDKFDEVQHLK